MKYLERCYDFLFRVAEFLLVLVTVIMFGAVTVAVFSRYVLNDSVAWADELPSLALIWLTFLGAAVLSRSNENLYFDGLTALLPERLQRVLEIFNGVLILIFLAILVYYGWKLAALTWTREAVTLPISMGLVRLVVPVSGVLMIIVYVVRISRAMLGFPLASPGDHQ